MPAIGEPHGLMVFRHAERATAIRFIDQNRTRPFCSSITRELFVLVLVLLALVAIGLLSLSTITIRHSQADAALVEARANARLALMEALNTLQEARR